jgi:hypothetical protein
VGLLIQATAGIMRTTGNEADYLLAMEDKAPRSSTAKLVKVAQKSQVISVQTLTNADTDHEDDATSWIRQVSVAMCECSVADSFKCLRIQITRQPYLIFCRAYETLVVLRIIPPEPEIRHTTILVSRLFGSPMKVTDTPGGPIVKPEDAGVLFVHWVYCIKPSLLEDDENGPLGG